MWMEVEAKMEVQYKRRQKILQKMLQTYLQMFFLLSNLHGFTMAADKSGGDLL
ncbi:hypothetical protein HanPI659440_Chr04g0145091 [Helianthus annuus]|nr:hypothetical protein HanPI659440_Chr04g0145091 [Helianthus annuus]